MSDGAKLYVIEPTARPTEETRAWLEKLKATGVLREVEQPPTAAAMREMAARVAENPYGDEVEAYGYEEPKAVGLKIAKAIRALPYDGETLLREAQVSAAAFKEQVLELLGGLDGMVEARERIMALPVSTDALDEVKARERLEEAYWWYHGGHGRGEESACERLAALEGKAGKEQT